MDELGADKLKWARTEFACFGRKKLQSTPHSINLHVVPHGADFSAIRARSVSKAGNDVSDHLMLYNSARSLVDLTLRSTN